jgi:electron transfer flavoprotein alpha subunit
MTRIRTMRRPRRDSGRIRRDPRAERLYSGKPSAATGISSPHGRPRRNPRAWHTLGVHPKSGRLRIDRSRPPILGVVPVATSGGPKQPTQTPQVRRIVIDQPACWILAVPDLDDVGRLTHHDRDIIGAARLLADVQQGAVVVIAFAGEDDLGAAGADRVIRFEGPKFQAYAPEIRAQAVVEVIRTLKPRHVALPDTLTGGGDLGRRVAALLGESYATQVQKLTPDQVIGRSNGGKSDFLMAPPRLILLAPEAADPVINTLHEARPMPAPEVGTDTRIKDLGAVPVDPNAVPLKEADFIVSAGNGVTDWTAFHQVAAALGATEGGSRVVCDAGLLPRDRQIGASGTLVDPRCYIAFGIAGAPQHLQGITRCERVVAVNTDLHAEMIKRADLAIVADAQKVMPALTQLL